MGRIIRLFMFDYLEVGACEALARGEDKVLLAGAAGRLAVDAGFEGALLVMLLVLQLFRLLLLLQQVFIYVLLLFTIQFFKYTLVSMFMQCC